MNSMKKEKSLFNMAESYQPYYFTASTGNAHIFPIDEQHIDWLTEMEAIVSALVAKGITKFVLAVPDALPKGVIDRLTELGGQARYVLSIKGGSESAGVPMIEARQLRDIQDIDAVLVLATYQFSNILRHCEQYLKDSLYIVPATAEAIVPSPIMYASPYEWSWRSTILNYLKVSKLQGSFAEFGTFYGSAFFRSYFELHHWLEGNFYAFDSFEGLSQPLEAETQFTNGDFIKGAYGFNQRSFTLIAELLGLKSERFKSIKGFFNESLTAVAKEQNGLQEKCISVRRIDCDLLESTLDVLRFVEPLLEDGALIYFDDWRLCRGNPKIGERGAVKQWLKENPHIDLLEFDSTHWQHQWFIFNRIA